MNFARRAHHVANAMAIGIAVDARQRALGIGANRNLDGLRPSGAMLRLEHIGERPAGLNRFGQRADAAFAQLRHQGLEDAGGRHGIAERGMPVDDFDVQPGGEIFQRISGEIGLRDLGEKARIERARQRPGDTGQRAFALEDGKVEADRVADHHFVFDEGREFAARFPETQARMRPLRRRCRG